MTRIFATTYIARPVEEVYNYVTTPGNWPSWHPSSIAVTGDADHPQEIGEQCTEEFMVAGRHGKAVWTVTDREYPSRWVISGVIEGSRSGGVVSYTLHSEENGTRFERTFTYPRPSLLFAILDILLIRRRVQAESNLAVQQLKDVLAKQAARS